MKTRIHWSLIVIFALCLGLPTLPAQTRDICPATGVEAMRKLGEQNADPSDSKYARQFMFSVWDRYHAAEKQGTASGTKSPYNLLFVIAADGRIERIFHPDRPPNQSLGKYIALRMKGVQVPKPPKAHWVVSVAG